MAMQARNMELDRDGGAPDGSGTDRIRVGSNRLQSVQELVATGEYRVDSDLVATAMLERIGATVSDRELISATEGGRVLLEALSGLRAA
jgi:hypothetical protein